MLEAIVLSKEREECVKLIQKEVTLMLQPFAYGVMGMLYAEERFVRSLHLPHEVMIGHLYYPEGKRSIEDSVWKNVYFKLAEIYVKPVEIVVAPQEP